MKIRAAALAAALLLSHAAPGAARALPIYIEDSHSGSFYWLAQHLDLDEPCTLLHFDAHSDASAVFDSDIIRAALRHVTSPNERQELLERWRGQGTIQCFDWIEPLMPAPIGNVLWVPAASLPEAEKTRRTSTAHTQIDGHLEAAPRQDGSFQHRYDVLSLDRLTRDLPVSQPLVATIDLDYFAGLPGAEQTAAFARIWDLVAQQPNLRAMTFAISRPYLQSDEEANRLLLQALRAALSLPTAHLQFEPFLRIENDQSSRARELRQKKQPVPSYALAQASPELRALLLAQRDRIQVNHDQDRWTAVLREWESATARLHLEVDDAEPSTDGAWRIPSTQSTTLRVVAEPWLAKPDHVEWVALVPKNCYCNVTDLNPEQVGFVAGAAARPIWSEQRIDCTNTTLPLARLDSLFTPRTHYGSIRVYARATVDSILRETPAIEIRRYAGTGFRAAITEQFGLPYLFGSGQLSNGRDTGPETNLGADCANFIVYALRRQGRRIPWSDPKALRTKLALVASSAKAGGTRITEEELERGLIVNLGAHVAAVMQDRPPVGLLDANDLVAHQLKGIPELLTLGELLRQRNRENFDVLTVPSAQDDQTIFFGGDIMLGRTCADKIARAIDPFAGLGNLLQHSSLAAANLECVITKEKNLSSSGPYSFSAPVQAAAFLHQAGFRAVGLANNHALDFGVNALHQCARILSEANVETVGIAAAGDRPEDAPAARIFDLPGNQNLALLAVSDLPRRETAPSAIAETTDRASLSLAIGRAREKASLVACLVHWGIENTAGVTERQRELARWLIDQGVDAVVGSHSHCLQPLDFYHGRPIAYSLGNLVFDGAPGVTSWNRGTLLQLRLSPAAKIETATLLPVLLQDGLPFLQAPPKRAIAQD